MPSLDFAVAKLERATQQIDELVAEAERAILADRSWEIHISSMVTGRFGLLGVAIDLPLGISCRIGETVYSVRSALDYLVYELFALNGGSDEGRTQFPITQTEQQWNKFVKSNKEWLGLFLPAQLQSLKGFQPHTGPKPSEHWLSILNEISNIDKHRTLRLIETTSADITARTIRNSNVKAVVVTARSKPEGVTDVSALADLYFREGLPVFETLRDFQRNAMSVILSFRAYFP